MKYKDDTPAIFYSMGTALEVKDLMATRDDIVAADVADHRFRGQMLGYTVICKAKDGRTFKVSNDMADRIHGQAA